MSRRQSLDRPGMSNNFINCIFSHIFYFLSYEHLYILTRYYFFSFVIEFFSVLPSLICFAFIFYIFHLLKKFHHLQLLCLFFVFVTLFLLCFSSSFDVVYFYLFIVIHHLFWEKCHVCWVAETQKKCKQMYGIENKP